MTMPGNRPVSPTSPTPWFSPPWWKLAREGSTAKRAHAGLLLDKYSFAADQETQKKEVTRVTQCTGTREAFDEALKRHQAMLQALHADTWQAATAGPLTLHLSRPSALENAGICLHPIYGFAYLPGSGLKGLARAYAETEWLPLQPDQDTAWRQLEEVFGWAPTPERRERIKKHPGQAHTVRDDKGDVVTIGECAGAVVFHDAWPVAWPKLAVDIVNNHHAKYYSGEDPDTKQKDPEPGDWEEPQMVYFLVVPAGTEFEFALSLRDAMASPKILEQAKEWLRAGLATLGAGAKTVAGYGRFEIEPEVLTAWPPERRYTTTLTLVTPAFLAGPRQDKTDCDLRPATLRGMLRWWWRTLYSDIEQPALLRALESAIWGSTECQGAVAVTVRPTHKAEPTEFGKIRQNAESDFHKVQQQFRNEHKLRTPGKAGTKAEGLFYLAYGMNERARGTVVINRPFAPPGSSWEVTFLARDAESVDWITAEEALAQARAALWLLRHFGGVGAKCRKGFGCFDDDPDSSVSLKWCLDQAKGMKKKLNKAPSLKPSGPPPYSESAVVKKEVMLGQTDPWWVLHEAGFGLQAYAVKHHHDSRKEALGLPRKIHGPLDRPLGHQRSSSWKPPLFLGEKHTKLAGRKAKDMRHASPLHLHVGRAPDGTIVFRATAFPQKYLPNLNTSWEVLEEAAAHICRHIEEEGAKGEAPRLPAPSPPEPKAGKGGEKPKAPEPPHAPSPQEKDQAVQFMDWFKTASMSPRKKGSHNQIMNKLAEITDPEARKRVRRFLGNKFTSKDDTSREVWEFIHSDD